MDFQRIGKGPFKVEEPQSFSFICKGSMSLFSQFLTKKNPTKNNNQTNNVKSFLKNFKCLTRTQVKLQFAPIC